MQESFICKYNDIKSAKVYSKYFNPNRRKSWIFLVQLFISMCSMYLYQNDIVQIYTIDNIFALLVNIIHYHKLPINHIIYQINDIDRYEYYCIVLIFYYFMSFTLWINIQYMVLLVSIPYITEIIVNWHIYINIKSKVDGKINTFLLNILSKKIAKIINHISIKCFNYYPNHKVINVKLVSKKLVLDFIFSFMIASVLRYFEQTGPTLYTTIFRQYYFKEFVKTDDSEYILNIIRTQNWNILIQPYSLNKLLNVYMSCQDAEQIYINEIIRLFKNSILKITSCWIIYSLLQIKGSGIVSFLIFNDNNLILLFIFGMISYNSTDQVLLIILCEICCRFNFVIVDILRECIKHVQIKKSTIINVCVLTIYPSIWIIPLLLLLKNYKLCLLLIAGYVSNYNIYHCLGLPFIFQDLYIDGQN